jgi:hypothetical protein
MTLAIAIIATIIVSDARPLNGAEHPDDSRRMVLVELYTSQGCDMCPAAEKLLGAMAERNSRIVPIAFHVDYFDNPWKDVFSDQLYSQRQMNYNELYTKPKSAEYGLYYTPMLMIDGQQSVNGRDRAAAERAIEQALTRKPAVSLDVRIDPKSGGPGGTAEVKVASRSAQAGKTPLLLCAVLREDNVVTQIGSGENGGKASTARFPARQTKYDFIELNGSAPATKQFAFTVEPSWNRRNLRLAVFVQDKHSGVVYQAADQPWLSDQSAPAAANSSIAKSSGAR